MNKKERRLALCSILSSKVKSNNVLVVDALNFSEAKTKNMVSVLNAIPYTKNVLLALASKNEVIEKYRIPKTTLYKWISKHKI